MFWPQRRVANPLATHVDATGAASNDSHRSRHETPATGHFSPAPPTDPDKDREHNRAISYAYSSPGHKQPNLNICRSTSKYRSPSSAEASRTISAASASQTLGRMTLTGIESRPIVRCHGRPGSQFGRRSHVAAVTAICWPFAAGWMRKSVSVSRCSGYDRLSMFMCKWVNESRAG